jgi:hypothetical protein
MLLSQSDADVLIILPDTFRAVLVATLLWGLCRRRVRTVLWIMDDFMGGHRAGTAIRNRVADGIFRRCVRKADRVIVVSRAMSRAYERLYGRRADQILGKSLAPGKVLVPRDRPADLQVCRLVFIGTFLEIYAEPMRVLRVVLKRPELSHVHVDLYGPQAPTSPGWELPGRMEYRGRLAEDEILPTLSQCVAGLVTYSFDPRTRREMGLSFPSKMIDYLAAARASQFCNLEEEIGTQCQADAV